MIIFSPYYFTLLKNTVLVKAGVKQLIPSDCQRLSTLIYADTKKRVSETTLKRIFGFAISKFKPSPFTLQALSEYCGYKGWEDFCSKEEVSDNNPVEKSNWQSLCTRTNRITHFTLQSLKKRSGIPFDLTLKRKFITEHFDTFLQSNKSVTFLTAHAGYGKTVGLCYLVDDLLNQNLDNSCNQNTILFFSTVTITNVLSNDLNLGNLFLSFLGLHNDENLIELFEGQKSRSNNFYLIIDGFDEHMFKGDQYFTFFNQLIDAISYYSQYPWFKVILTMRSATWLNYRYLIEEKPSVYEKWYLGFMQDENKTTNVLPFSVDEIIALSKKINPATKPNFLPPIDVIKKLSNPLFFQLYYQTHTQNFTLEPIDQLCFYQIISSYAVNKIYHGINSMEKVLLLKSLMEMFDYKDSSFSIPKIKFYDYIKAHSNTYKELISNDIIREENFSKYLQYEEHISFSDNILLEYCLSRKLYGWNGEKLDSKLINEIEVLLGRSNLKIPILKWIVFYIINNNVYNQLNFLKEIRLQPLDRLEIIVFTCQLLQKQLNETKDPEKLKIYFSQIEQNETFSFFLSFQYITPDYEKALFTLLHFDLTNRNKILIYTVLSAINIINLNADKAEKYIEEIRKLPDNEHESFIVNPLHCLNALFCYYKYGIIQKEALQEITHLNYNDSKLKKMSFNEYAGNEIIFKLALLTLKLNNNPAKELRFINRVEKYLSLIDLKYPSSVYIFFLSLSVNAYFKTGNSKTAIKTQNEILQIQDSSNSIFTPFMKILFNLLSVKNSSQNNAEKVFLLQIKSLIAYSSKNGFKIAEVYAGILFLTSLQAKEARVEDLIEIYNNILKHIRTSGFRMESFISPEIQAKIQQQIYKRNKVA